jgi:hypothetical protein
MLAATNLSSFMAAAGAYRVCAPIPKGEPMYRFVKVVLAVSAGIAMIALQAAPAHAATTTRPQALLVGKLGFEGGPYPGGFHPTAGSVEVEFYSVPLVLEQPVGSSGRFKIPLSAGKYTVIGCGPSTSGGSASGQCSKPRNITLKPGEVDHIKLVWAYAP